MGGGPFRVAFQLERDPAEKKLAAGAAGPAMAVPDSDARVCSPRCDDRARLTPRSRGSRPVRFTTAGRRCGDPRPAAVQSPSGPRPTSRLRTRMAPDSDGAWGPRVRQGARRRPDGRGGGQRRERGGNGGTAVWPFPLRSFRLEPLRSFSLEGRSARSERLASARESPVRGEETMHSSTLFNAFARVQSTTTPPTWQDSVADGQNPRTPVILQVRRANKRAFRESNSLCVSVCASRRSAASIRSGVRSRSADKNGTRS